MSGWVLTGGWIGLSGGCVVDVLVAFCGVPSVVLSQFATASTSTLVLGLLAKAVIHGG